MPAFGPPNQNQFSFIAGANVTLSSSTSGGSQTITIIGGGTGATGTGVVASAGTQAASSGTVVYSNSHNVSFGMSGSSVITASASYNTNSNSFGISNLGNASGTSGIASGSSLFFLLAGGNNITLSQSLNGASGTITISAAAQSLQTSNVHNFTISGNTSGVPVQVSSGTLTLAGGANITLSQVGNAVTISGAPGGAQTGISGIIAGTSTAASGTISYANSNGVTWGLDGQTITASVSVGGNNLTMSGNTSGVAALVSSGTLTLAGGNNITLSQAGNAITISAAATAAQSAQTQSNIQAIIPLGNTTGTTGTIQTGSFGLAGGNNITISQSSGANSTRLTIIGAAGIPSIAAIGNTTGTVTIGGGSLILAGGNNVTLSGSTAAGGMTLSISVPNTASQTVQTQGVINVSASSGPGGGTTGTMGLVSTGTLTLAAGSNITLSQAGNAITIIAGQSTQTQGLGAIQLAAGAGSTTGTTAQVTLGTMTIAAGANITLSQAAGNAITVQGVPAATMSIGISAAGNTAGTTGFVTRSNVSLLFFGGNSITLSQSLIGNSQASLSIVGPSSVTNSFWIPPMVGQSLPRTYGQSLIHFAPVQVPMYLSASQARMMISGTISTSSNSSFAGSLDWFFGVYTRTGSTLSLASSGSQSYVWTNTSDNSVGSLASARWISAPVNVNLTPGDYWFANMSKTASANANWLSISNMMMGNSINASFGGASTGSVGFLPGWGLYSAASAALPASAAFTDMRNAVQAAGLSQLVALMNFSV